MADELFSWSRSHRGEAEAFLTRDGSLVFSHTGPTHRPAFISLHFPHILVVGRSPTGTSFSTYTRLGEGWGHVGCVKRQATP